MSRAAADGPQCDAAAGQNLACSTGGTRMLRCPGPSRPPMAGTLDALCGFPETWELRLLSIVMVDTIIRTSRGRPARALGARPFQKG